MLKNLSFSRLLFSFSLILILSSLTLLQAQDRSTYTVKSGDTLYGISKKIGVTLSELRNWNNIEGNDITVGQELIYFESEEVSTEPPVEGESIMNTGNTQNNVFYIVKAGDNLIKIAREHNMTLEQLRDLNDIQGDNIQVGQKLTVKAINYAPSISSDASESAPQGKFSLYTLERGESLSDLLNKFKLTRNEFIQLNPDINADNLARGQKVTVLLPPSKNYPNPFLDDSRLNDLGQVPVSVYSATEAGSTTTNGELYDPASLTAAHSNIAIGTILFVQNPESKIGIYVRINDRVTGNTLKLSEKAFQVLQFDTSSQSMVKIFTDS